MAMYRVQGPDGRIHRFEGPDNATPQEVEAFAAQTFGNLQREANAPKAEEPFAARLGRQVMNAAAGAVRGAGSIGATILTPVDAAARALGVENSVIGRTDRRQAMDAALGNLGADTDSLAYGAGKLGAEIAGTSGVGGLLAKGAAAVPGLAAKAPAVVEAIRTAGMSAGQGGLAARTVGGAVTGGASAALANPDDVGAGTAVGAALPGVVQAAGAAGRAVGKALSPNINNPELARKAVEQYGIPLGAADISASRGTKALRSVLNDAPLVGGIGERQGQRVQEGFNRAVGRTFGADAPSLTPEVVDAAKKRMGAEFDRIWGQNRLTIDVDMAMGLKALQDEVTKLPQGDAARLDSWLREVAGKAVDDGAGNMVIPGDVANRLQSKLRTDADKAQGFLKDSLLTLRRTLLDAFNRGVSPEDAAALATNRGQYKAFKTVEPLLQSAEAGVAGRAAGDIPAGLLPQAVRQSYRSGIAQSPFADLTQIGSQYLADRVARTGGGPRAMIQNSALGGAVTLGAFAEPMTLAAIPSSAAIQQVLGSPKVAQALLRANATGAPRAAVAAQEVLANPALAGLFYRGAPLALSTSGER